MEQDARSNNTFWAFLFVVLVLGVGAATFSYLARDAAADAARAHANELEKREEASKGLLERMLSAQDTGSDTDDLRRWFDARFRRAWVEAYPGTVPPDEVVLDAMAILAKKLEALPAEVVEEMTRKK